MKGVWTHAVGSFIVGWVVGAPTTCLRRSEAASASHRQVGLATFVIGMIYAIVNANIVRNHDLGKGWSEVAEG